MNGHFLYKGSSNLKVSMNKRLTIFGSLLAALCSVSTLAVGFRLPNQDPVAIARGNAFAATADNPSAIYYNPAGITQLEGQNLQFGLYTITVDSRYHSRGGQKSDTDFEIQPVPQFYYAYSPKESSLSFGIGAFAPYGLGLEWPEDSGFRTLAEEGRLAYVRLAPVVAWEVLPQLSLAVGPTINGGHVLLRRGISAPGDEFKFKGDGIGVGYTGGVMWAPHPQWSIGASYHSATEFTFHGHSTIRTPGAASNKVSTDAAVPFPQFVMTGISFRPNNRWNIEVDVDWTDWDALNTVTFQMPSVNVPFPFNFKSSFMYGVGATRYLKDGYFASGGYFFSENSVPDKNLNPAVRDTDQHSFSIGVGRKANRWSWAATYQMLTGQWRTVTGSEPSFIADGQYKFLNHALNVSIGYRF